jgi:riboflavin transporter FmnP
MKRKSEIFSAKRIAVLGVLIGLTYALTWLKIPMLLPFLKLDFSFAIMLIAGYMLGPLSAEIIVVIVHILGLIGSDAFGIGEIANFLMANVFVVLPTFIYKYKKGFKWVIIVLAVCSVLEIVMALLTNRFITYPLYFKESAKMQFEMHFWLLALFNTIKCVANGTVTVILYKRLKNLLNKFL